MAVVAVSLVTVSPSAATPAGATSGTTGPRVTDPATGPGSYALVNVVGDVSTFGGAHYAGDRYDEPINRPIVGATTTPDRAGYWLVASDGGVFTFGDAGFYGSTGGMHLNRPIVGMAATADGGGYWLVASDGGVFTFGDAPFFGSTGDLTLAAPITGVATTPDGAGYMLVAGDGGVFTFGDAQFSGSAASDLHPPDYAAAFSSTPPGTVAGMYLAPGSVPSAGGPVRVLLSGDSLSVQTALGWASVEQSYGAWVESGGILGCGVGVTGATATASWNSSSGAAGPVWAACMNWQQHLHTELALSHPNVVVVLAGYWESQHWQWGGQWVTLADPSFQAEVAGQLADLSALVHSYGAELVLLSTPYFDDGTPDNLVDIFNSLLAQTPDAQVLDLHGLLDPGDAYAQDVDGIVARNNDGVHLSSAGVAQLMAPALLSPIVAIGSQTQ